MPKVTVFTPTHNRAHLLPRAINSVLNQTYKDFEYLVVDDGSTDNTKEIVESFQKNDSRIRYIYQEYSGGYPSKALNTAIKESKGDFIVGCASDDEIHPTYVEKLLNVFFQDKNVDVVGSNVAVYDEDNNFLGEVSKPPSTNNEFIIKTSLVKNYLFGNLMFKKEVFQKVGLFDEKIKIREDFDMWIKLAKSGAKFKFVYEPLFITHTHSNQISSSVSLSERIKIYDYLFRKHRDAYEKYALGKSIHFRHMSTMYALRKEKNKALRYIILSIKSYPFYWKNYVNLFLILAGLQIFDFALKLKQKHSKFSL